MAISVPERCEKRKLRKTLVHSIQIRANKFEEFKWVLVETRNESSLQIYLQLKCVRGTEE